MTQYESVRTPQDYVNYTFNISSKGVTQVAGELAGLSSTVSTILGDIAFKTSEFLSHTEMMTIGAGSAVSAVFVKATQDAIRFEQQVANVKAIGGESVDAALIGDKAMEYSNKLGMAVSEMTEGLEALARAGITTTSVMTQVLEEGVKLSKLEGISLEDSVNHLISTTNLLSQDKVDMNAPEYAQMLKDMNQHIVSTSESAPINAENIMQTLQHVGGYASASGIDQDDLFAVIAQLGARGTKGEIAGTALRAFVSASNKDTAQRALARVGLDVTDLWDATGETMLSISEMKDVLDNALDARGYSKQEKLEFYSDFVGYKQANQIMKIDTTEVEKYKDSIANAWDLGTKLNTILGTVKGNLDRIWQISQNFMTKVGGKLLPVINAMLIPIRVGLELFTKIPFMDSLGAGLALFAGLKTILLVINNIVPAIGGLFSSMRSQKQYAKGIRGEWEKTRDAIKDAYKVISNIRNTDKLAQIHRQRRGPSAEDKAHMEDTIFEAMYYESKYYQELNIPWKELEPALQHSIGRVFLGTTEFETNWERMQKRNEAIAESIGDEAKILDFGEYDPEGELSTINRYVQYIYSIIKETNSPTSKLDQNKQQHMFGGSTKQETSRQPYSGGSESPKVEVVINGRNTSQSAFQFEDINKLKSSIDVSEYGDYEHIYRNNVQQLIKDYNQAINDLVRKTNSFSNTKKEHMDRVQMRRYEKSLRREAMSEEGVRFASRANDSDIRYYLRTGVYRKPKDKMLGIKDDQIKAMAEKVGLDFSDIDNITGPDKREEQLAKIRQELKKKNISIDDVAEEANKVWVESQQAKRKVTYVPTQLLRDNKDMTLQLAAMFTQPTDDINQAVKQVQSFFANETDEATIASATRAMMGHLKLHGQTFSKIEEEEIKYILENIVRLENTASKLNIGLEDSMRVFSETANYNHVNKQLTNFWNNNGIVDELFDNMVDAVVGQFTIVQELVAESYIDWIKSSTPGAADNIDINAIESRLRKKLLYAQQGRISTYDIDDAILLKELYNAPDMYNILLRRNFTESNRTIHTWGDAPDLRYTELTNPSTGEKYKDKGIPIFSDRDRTDRQMNDDYIRIPIDERTDAERRADKTVSQMFGQFDEDYAANGDKYRAEFKQKILRKRADAFWAEQERLEQEAIYEEASKNASTMFNNFDTDYEENQEQYRKDFRRQKQSKYVTFIEDLLENIYNSVKNKTVNVNKWFDENFLNTWEDNAKVWGETADQLRHMIEPLEAFNRGLSHLSEIFPILTPLVYGLDKVLEVSKTIISGLRTAETLLIAVRIASGKETEDLSQKEGYQTAKKYAEKMKQYIPEGSDLYKILDGVGEYATRAFSKLKYIFTQVIGFVAENIAMLGPIAAAIAIAVGTLWISEQKHAKALKQATEEHEKSRQEAAASYITYQNIHDARKQEHDAMKRQQLARKESIALYELEADRIKQLHAIKEETELRNDPLWGEYGARAKYQKMSWLDAFLNGNVIGLISKYLAGDFESQYENYEGSTGEIRRVKEDSLGIWANGNQRAVSAWYDSHVQQLGQIEAFAPELQKLYDLESQLIERYGSLEAARDSEEFNKAVQEFSDATGINKETAEKYLDYLQTEANVENARYAMQAEVNIITSKAQAEAYKALYGDESGIGDLNGIQDAMVYATADQIFKDAYHELWWNMLMEWLQAIYSVLTLHWGDAGKHAKAAEAYQNGMRELAENQGRITEEGVEIAKENQRKDYGNEDKPIYDDTPFGAAYESAAAEEQGWMEENAYSNQSKTYDASKANGKAAVKGFKDGLNQHSPGDIAMAMADELGYMQHFITVFPFKIFSKLAQRQTDEYQDNLGIGDSFDFFAGPQPFKKGPRTRNNIETIQKDILHQQRKLNETVDNIDSNVDSSVNQWYASGHNNGDNSYSARAKNAFWYDKGFGLPPGVDPNDPAVQEELKRRQAETGMRLGGHGAGSWLANFLSSKSTPGGVKGAVKWGMKGIGKILNPEEVKLFDSGFLKYIPNSLVEKLPNSIKKMIPKSTDDIIETSGKAIDDVAELGVKSTDDLLKVGSKGVENAGKTGARRVIPILGEEAGEQAIKVGTKKGAETISETGTKGLVKAGEKGLAKTGAKATGEAGAKAGAKGLAKTGGKALAKAAPFIGPFVTAAFSIAEHNPFEKHYNEDGSEKRALQSTGEVAGEIAGSVIAMGLGMLSGPFAPLVEMGASLILEPVGKAVGGMLGWAGDELFNGAMGLLFGNEEEQQVNPSDISAQVDSSTFDSFQDSIGSTGGSFAPTTGNLNKTDNVAVNDSKTIVHIHNININTEDNPEKIKSALMELIVEFGEQVTPRQVSRIIGEPPSAATSTTTETTENTDANAQDPNNPNGNTNGNSNTNPTV